MSRERTDLEREEVQAANGFSAALEIPDLDAQAMEAAQERLDALAKPPGSLGRLERLAVQLAGMQGSPKPRAERMRIAVFAGDHGVVCEGVSAYPSEVTARMAEVTADGRSAIGVFAQLVGAELLVTDVGVAAPLAPRPRLVQAKIRAGTRNLARGPALEREEVECALAIGATAAPGVDVLATGELGIGNTTAAAALTAAFTEWPVAAVTGRGTGISDAALARKIAVIEGALERLGARRRDPLAVLAEVGGLEIAALAGLIVNAAQLRIPVVLDGFIAGAAALTAVRIEPRVRHFLIAGHRSTEPGHAACLDALGLVPLLDLGLRLGEGTGAALALPLLRAATRMLGEMATLAEVGAASPC